MTAVKVATSTGVTSFTVTGVPADQDAVFRSTLSTVELSYDRSSAGPGNYSFQMKPNITVNNRESTVNQALQTIERRVNELGVAEPLVQKATEGRPWQKPHQPNPTGTPEAYRPKGHEYLGGKRARATGDYRPWTPD